MKLKMFSQITVFKKLFESQKKILGWKIIKQLFLLSNQCPLIRKSQNPE